MANPLQLPPSNVPIIDARDGSMSKPWRIFFGALVDRAGGVLGGLQPEDDTLTALAGLNASAGLVVETALDTFTKRTLTGVAPVVITNGAGTAGNPTVSTTGVTGTKTPPASVTVVNGIITAWS